ncbi:exosortase-associated EpsI family protein [Rhodopirellula sp. JC639]|uniref:exosortase-associated EpsI family protein n=1 Tax=Stieleria mannarensis TaxID=2755585 RepID=UPI0016045461|nr:exosortase-associated EpsI family protein [Rhodopirellula sp. JC639]
MTRSKIAVLGCLLSLTSCLVTSGWRTAPPPRCAFEPAATLGPWQLLERDELEPRELEILQASDHWRAAYRHPQTGQVVVVTLIAGAAGPLASHSPETCYARQEYRSLSDAVVWKLPETSDNFRFQTLHPRNVDQPALTIAYGWHDGTRWSSPRSPRFQFAGRPTLQRMLVTTRHPGGLTAAARQTLQQVLQWSVNEPHPPSQPQLAGVAIPPPTLK